MVVYEYVSSPNRAIRYDIAIKGKIIWWICAIFNRIIHLLKSSEFIFSNRALGQHLDLSQRKSTLYPELPLQKVTLLLISSVISNALIRE